MTAATPARQSPLARAKAREQEALDAWAWADDPPLALAPGLELQWLGTAGFRFTAEGTTLLIDPYASRAGLRDVANRRRPLRPSAALIDAHLPRADAVLVGHTHFDHALDVPAVVRRDDATAYGSSSLTTLMALHGLGDRTVEVQPYQAYEIGPFTVRFVPSRHSKLLAGLKVPSGGELVCDHVDDLTSSAYQCGQVWGIHIEVGGMSLYHQGSADLEEDERIPHEVDVFLCGIAGRAFSRNYVNRIIRRLDPKVVIPHHWDDFLRPLDAPLGFSPNVRLHRFADEVETASRHIPVRTLRLLETVRA